MLRSQRVRTEHVAISVIVNVATVHMLVLTSVVVVEVASRGSKQMVSVLVVVITVVIILLIVLNSSKNNCLFLVKVNRIGETITLQRCRIIIIDIRVITFITNRSNVGTKSATIILTFLVKLR